MFLRARLRAASRTLAKSAPLRKRAPTKFVRSASITAVTASLEISDSSKTHSSSSSKLSRTAPALMTRPPSETTPPPRSTATLVPASVSISAFFTDPFGALCTLTNCRPVVVRIIERSTLEPFGLATLTAPRFFISFCFFRRRFSSDRRAFSTRFLSLRESSIGKATSSSSSKSSHSSSATASLSIASSSSRSSQSSSLEEGDVSGSCAMD